MGREDIDGRGGGVGCFWRIELKTFKFKTQFKFNLKMIKEKEPTLPWWQGTLFIVNDGDRTVWIQTQL